MISRLNVSRNYLSDFIIKTPANFNLYLKLYQLQPLLDC